MVAELLLYCLQLLISIYTRVYMVYIHDTAVTCYLVLFGGAAHGSRDVQIFTERCQGVLIISWVGSGRAKRFSNFAGQVGSGQKVFKSLGSGQVGSSQEVFKSSRVGSGHDPQETGQSWVGPAGPASCCLLIRGRDPRIRHLKKILPCARRPLSYQQSLIPGLFTVRDSTRGLGQEVCEMSRIGSGRVGPGQVKK